MAVFFHCLIMMNSRKALNLKWYDTVYAGKGLNMRKMLIHWIIMALAVWLTSLIVPGIYVSGPVAALIAAIAIGLANATIGLFLKIITFPLTIVTLGIFWLVINGIMLKLASAFVPGFHIRSFAAAFWGAIVLSVVNMLLKWLVLPRDRG
jgi:putative membrane protein